jgi:hypothetical protein
MVGKRDNYGEYFLSMNSPKREAFDAMARAYSAWYRKFLPANKNAKILDLAEVCLRPQHIRLRRPYSIITD